MKGIRCFFNLPFLKLKVRSRCLTHAHARQCADVSLFFVQRQYIIQQLKENEADLDAADQELELVNSEQNYDLYAPLAHNVPNSHIAIDLNLSVLALPPCVRAAISSGWRRTART
jgi:hypothetical protein